MKKLKSALSLILAVCMVLGLVVVSTAASNTIESVSPMEGLAGSGYAEVVGQKTIVDYDNIYNGSEFKVRIELWVDRESYRLFNGVNLLVRYDTDIFQFESAPGRGNLLVSAMARPDGRMGLGIGSNDPSIYAAADGFSGYIEATFSILDADAFKAVSPATGHVFGFDTSVDLGVVKNDAANDFIVTQLDEDGLTSSIDAVVTYSANTVTYNKDGGTGTVPAPVPVGRGAEHEVLGGITLTKVIGGVNNVLDGWLYEGRVYQAGESFVMPNRNISIIAQYTPDADGDGKGDKYENAVTFTLRDEDVATLDFPASTEHGSFYDVTPKSGTIGIEDGEKIGTAFPNVTLPTDWVFDGFYVGDTKIDDIEDYVPTGDTPITIRTILDANGNGIDDREDVEVTFMDGGEEVDIVEVPDNTPYIIYTNPEKDPSTATEGKVDGSDPVVDLSGIADATDSEGNPFDHWEVNIIEDGDGNVIGVEVVPVYEQDVPVVIPGPIVDEDDEEPEDEKEIELRNGDVIVYRGIDSVEVARITVDRGQVTSGAQTLVPPALGSHAKLPEKHNGNAFKSWVFSGPVVIDDVTYYYLDARYEASVGFEVLDSEGNVVLDDEVPGDSTFEVFDENGDPVISGDVKDHETLTLPEVPDKNDDGEIFTGWEVIGEDTDGDGEDDKFTFKPEYELPEIDDVEILPDPEPGTEPGTNDGIDTLTGEGFTILRGAWSSDATATAKFYLRIASKPADERDLQNITFTVAPIYGFERFPVASFGTLNTNAAFVGTETIGDKEYGVFEVTYTAAKSGIVRINASYGALDGAANKGHVVITVGDNDVSGRIVLSDQINIMRVLNEITDEPVAGSGSGYTLELMDVDKTGRLALADGTNILRMLNGIVPSN